MSVTTVKEVTRPERIATWITRVLILLFSVAAAIDPVMVAEICRGSQ